MKTRTALVGALLVTFANPALAQNFNQLIAFGDSTTDTGWFANAKLSSDPNVFDSAVATSVAAGGNAHFTGPGPGNAQILGSFFGLTANAANTPGGTNYAIGGAFDNAGPAPYAEWTNIFLLENSLPPNPALPTTTEQINDYLASVNGHANPNALYLISSGGNDVFIAIGLGLSPQSNKTPLRSESPIIRTQSAPVPMLASRPSGPGSHLAMEFFAHRPRRRVQHMGIFSLQMPCRLTFSWMAFILPKRAS